MKEFLVFAVLLAAIIAGYIYSMIPIDFATFGIFILIMGLLIYRDRKKVKLQGIVLIRRTQKGRNFIDRTARGHRTFWNAMGIMGVIIAIPALIVGSFFLINQGLSILSGTHEGGVRLLLPGPVASPQNLPGVFVVPWWIWIIGVAIVIIPHEFMHGIQCRVDKVKIKSVGWILLAVIPGAFVEPDEKQLQRSKRSTKMKVYAAGSFANILTALIVLIILAVYSASSFTAAGTFVRPIEGGPAAAINLTGTVTAIDNHQIASAEGLRETLKLYKPGDVVIVKVVGGQYVVPTFHLNGWDFFSPKPSVVANSSEKQFYSVALGTNPNTGGAYLGVAALLPSVYYTGSNYAAYQLIGTLMLWIYIFSLGIGIVNILPIKPLDGGLLFEEIAGHFTSRSKIIVKVVSGIMLAILLFNLLGPLVF